MNIKQLRKKHSVSAIAEAAGVSQAQVRNWLSQDRNLLELKAGGWVVDSDRVAKIKPIKGEK